jgi:hypothetical protein
MLNYEKLYRIIFNGITDALDSMDKEGYSQAKMKLVSAQQAAEEYFISGEEDGLREAEAAEPALALDAPGEYPFLYDDIGVKTGAERDKAR